MNLYLVHCGYYETQVSGGIFESHVNLSAAAESFEEAKQRVRLEPSFQAHRMHIDGIQELKAAQGYRIKLEADPGLEGRSLVNQEAPHDL